MIEPDIAYHRSIDFLCAANLLYALELAQLSRRPIWRAMSFNALSPAPIAIWKTVATSSTPLGIVTALLWMSQYWMPRAMPLLAALSFIALVLLHHTQKTGLEGSDQVRLWLTGFLAVCNVLSPFVAAFTAEVYLSCTAALAAAFYAGAGIAKASNREWWNGVALQSALSTRLFGHKWLYAQLQRYPRMAAGLASAIIIWELSFVLAMHASFDVAVVYVGIALFFHVMVAAFMRLPMFVPAALAMAPGVLFIASRLHGT